MKVVLEKVDRIGSLFELYGELLTPRQKELTEYYYFDDLSLAEIAEELQISRQAVFFGLRRSEEILESFEEKLGLFEKAVIQKSKLDQVKNLISEYRSSCESKKLSVAEEILDGLLD